VAGLSHFDDQGAGRMVDVSAKPLTLRVARAAGSIRMAPATLDRIRNRDVGKGDVLAVARLAGIMAAKRTAELIPLCHPLALESVSVDFSFPDAQTISAAARAQVTGRTGVEMEALTAVSIALLTIYDMCKSVDRGMVVSEIQLEEKTGGASGHFQRSCTEQPSD
jgi:cyclic pyranopterin phosphate synthase